jgi:putative membrane protein (TIGR04086 family)
VAAAGVKLDWRAVAFGAVVAIVIAVPPAVLFQALVGADVVDEDSALALPLFLVQMAGFFAGGYVAARKRPDAPFSHGPVAGLAGFLTAQAVAVVFIVARGDTPSIVKIAFGAMLSSVLGLFGAVAADRGAAARTP